MVTSCAILIGGMLTHYAAINDRLRGMTRERLSLLRQPSGALELSDAPLARWRTAAARRRS